VPIECAVLLDITIFAPFCSLGLCQTQSHSLFNTPFGSPHTSSTCLEPLHVEEAPHLKDIWWMKKYQGTVRWQEWIRPVKGARWNAKLGQAPEVGQIEYRSKSWAQVMFPKWNSSHDWRNNQPITKVHIKGESQSKVP
jgi:hypothetical protein